MVINHFKQNNLHWGKYLNHANGHMGVRGHEDRWPHFCNFCIHEGSMEWIPLWYREYTCTEITCAILLCCHLLTSLSTFPLLFPFVDESLSCFWSLHFLSIVCYLFPALNTFFYSFTCLVSVHMKGSRLPHLLCYCLTFRESESSLLAWEEASPVQPPSVYIL